MARLVTLTATLIFMSPSADNTHTRVEVDVSRLCPRWTPNQLTHKHVFATGAVLGTRGPMRESRCQQSTTIITATTTPDPRSGGSQRRGGVQPTPLHRRRRRRLPGVWSEEKNAGGGGCDRRTDVDAPGQSHSCRYTHAHTHTSLASYHVCHHPSTHITTDCYLLRIWGGCILNDSFITQSTYLPLSH